MDDTNIDRRNFLTRVLQDDTSLGRRDFLSASLALGAFAALPGTADAQGVAAGRLTCHVLDTYSGRPAGGMRVDLSLQEGGAWKLVKSALTVDSGRTADPLMTGDGMQTGNFMLEFFHAEYFKVRAFLPTPPFYDRVVHYFAIPVKTVAYHITLVTAPWGYTTYRWKE